MASPLKRLLSEAGVQDTFSDKLEEDGWTIPLFACSASNLEQFDISLKEILGELYDIVAPIQKAALRLAWQRCSQDSVTAPPESGPAEPASSSSTSWSESFAPKLTTSVVSELKKQFKANFPAEVLVPENMPGIRLLSLVHDVKVKNDIRWVPWKFRISQQKADELSNKSNRIPKAESLQLHNLILDSPPEINIDNGALGLMAIRQMFEVWALALAICGIAHLATLKGYYIKFMSFMSARLDSDTGLRGPTILESQAADRTIMGLVSDLVTERGWSLTQHYTS